jgi:hypothetical protein
MKNPKKKPNAILAGHPVKEEKLGKDNNFKKYPTSIHFYYIEVDQTGSVSSRLFFYDQLKDISENDLAKILPYLYFNARNNGGVPPEYGTDIRKLEWKRKSYLAFMIKSATYELTSADQFEFDQKTPNHSFFDAKPVNVTSWMDSSGTQVTDVSGLRMINHMKRDEGGHDLEPKEKQKYIFKITLASRGKSRDTQEVDGGGTNMGPPVGPPYILLLDPTKAKAVQAALKNV